MQRSTDRILTTHAGGLERPPELAALLRAKERGEPYDQREFNRRVADAVAEIVEWQEGCGIDIVNDGEESKSWLNYARDRLSGLTRRPLGPDDVATDSITAREEKEFGEYFRTVGFGFSRGFAGGGALREARDAADVAAGFTQTVPMGVFCTGPIEYIGLEAAKLDIDNLEKACAGKDIADAVLTAIAPGTIEHWLRNQYYPDTESFLFAIADAMNVEYRAITDAGIVLQIDDPDLPDAWAIHPEMTLSQYRDYAELRVEAINRALRGVPEEMVRLHVCWGSIHGPHVHDLPLKDFADIVLKVRAQGYSIEAANPRHDHEWTVWRDVKLPEGKLLIPGVVGHYTDIIEHPELIAERLESYAGVVGRENVIAGTDCGIGPRVGHPKITWAKFEAMAEGARIASRRLWK